MNTQLRSFYFNSIYDVRVQLINSEPWFCLNDVCKALTVINSSDLLSKQLDKAGVEKIYLRSDGQRRQFAFVNEPNLYRVIFRSNKPEPKQFQDWVFNEVLPSIRKTGKYEHPQPRPEAPELLNDNDTRNLAHLVWSMANGHEFRTNKKTRYF
ncbi:BRO-N domain-containing protein [Arsenophonus sp. PmNCSU2021_1]|uniref:BRO-N domain-containing protein n=1 Tax=Arsenophonus sp. PmNCSU2021_1 TaxID=3118989 RepID=UPI002FEE8E47